MRADHGSRPQGFEILLYQLEQQSTLTTIVQFHHSLIREGGDVEHYMTVRNGRRRCGELVSTTRDGTRRNWYSMSLHPSYQRPVQLEDEHRAWDRNGAPDADPCIVAIDTGDAYAAGTTRGLMSSGDNRDIEFSESQRTTTSMTPSFSSIARTVAECSSP